MSEIIEISVPTDTDGYLLLQCPYCGQFFSAPPSDVESDTVLFLHCPACGLSGESFVTEDVMETALAIAKNKMLDSLHAEMVKMERRHNRGAVKFKAGPPPKHVHEEPIHAWINEMEIVTFPCCHLTGKIRPLLKMTGCYCIYCGVKCFEFE